MADIDLTWAHPLFAERLRKLFLNVRRDGEGRLSVVDMKLRFQRHTLPLLGKIERVNGCEWAFLSDNHVIVLKDWAMCAGVYPFCPLEDPKYAKMRTKNGPKRRKKLCHV